MGRRPQLLPRLGLTLLVLGLALGEGGSPIWLSSWEVRLAPWLLGGPGLQGSQEGGAL